MLIKTTDHALPVELNPNRIHVNDRVTYAITQREYTDEGFLRVPGRVARTGIQDYRAGELGLKGDPNRIVRVMRPANEVFSPDSLATYRGADITIEHPKGMVDANTYKNVSVGTTLDIGSQDGEFVKCDLIIKDKEGIKAAEHGKVQLSVGYTALYDDKVPADADYEFIQRDIRVNHIALVDNARAGAQARLYDNKPEKHTMFITLKSGAKVEIADEATAQLIQDSEKQLVIQVTDAETAASKSKDDLETMTASRDSVTDELKDEKLKTTDEAINKKVDDLALVKDQAAKVGGKDFTCDSTDEITIKRAALSAASPKKDWTDKSDAYVVAAFDLANEKEMEDEDEEEESEDGKGNKGAKKKGAHDSHKQLAIDAAASQAQNKGPRQKTIDKLSEAWKTTVGGNA